MRLELLMFLSVQFMTEPTPHQNRLSWSIGQQGSYCGKFALPSGFLQHFPTHHPMFLLFQRSSSCLCKMFLRPQLVILPVGLRIHTRKTLLSVLHPYTLCGARLPGPRIVQCGFALHLPCPVVHRQITLFPSQRRQICVLARVIKMVPADVTSPELCAQPPFWWVPWPVLSKDVEVGIIFLPPASGPDQEPYFTTQRKQKGYM